MPDTHNITPGDLCQVGMIVKDIETTIHEYAKLLKIKPPNIFFTANYESAHTLYHGKPTNARAKIAIIQTGQVPLEIIQPIGGPSIWQEFLDTEGEGVHHIAFLVSDTDSILVEYQKRGIVVLQQGEFTGGRYTYIDTKRLAGTIIELLEIYK